MIPPTDDKLYELYRPLSPVLTQQARRETPILGCTGALTSIPRTMSSLQNHLILRPVADEVIIDPPTPDMNDVLLVPMRSDRARSLTIVAQGRSVQAERSVADKHPFATTSNIQTSRTCNGRTECCQLLEVRVSNKSDFSTRFASTLRARPRNEQSTDTDAWEYR